MAILRNVAKTDTLETQRQKINLIASDIFNIAAGGSDLSTGNLKLGDGTRTEPSLAFLSEGDLGLYKPLQKTLGIVSEGKKVTEFSNLGTYSFKDMVVQRRELSSSPTAFTILNSGSNYDAGSYSNIRLLGGTGDGAEVTIAVTEYSGTLTSKGSGYRPGQYIDIGLSGGNGTGATASFIVRGLTGTVLNEGSGYEPGTYENVPLTGGSGTGALATIFVAPPGAGTPGGNVTSVTITNSGNNAYNTGEILSANNTNLGGTGSGFQFEITAENPGQIELFSFGEKGNNYQTNDILSLPGSKTGVSTNLRGEILDVSTTLSTDSPIITVASTTGVVAGMTVFTAQGDDGSLLFGTTVLSVDSSTQVTLSQNPSTSGSATLTFRSQGNLNEIVVSSLEGIFTDSIVTQTSGTGQLDVNTTVTNIDTFTNTVTLSSAPILAGTAVLSFAPPYGVPVTNFSYTVGTLGLVENFSITSGGNGYSISDTLTVNPSDLSAPIVYFVKNISVQKLYFSSLIGSAIEIGDTIKKIDGAVITTTLQSSSSIEAEADQSYFGVTSTTNGNGEGAQFNVFRGFGGIVSSVIVVSGGGAGLKYKTGDIITISGTQVGGSSPADNIVLEVTSATENFEYTVYGKVLDGSNIDYIVTETDQSDLFEADGVIVKNNNYADTYTIATASFWAFRYLIDLGEGNGFELTPSWDIYIGDTYLFDLTDSSNTSHVFAFSVYRDGIWEPSYIQNVSTTLSILSPSITVDDTEGILPGMNVIFVSGDGALAPNTKVLSVPDSTTVILDSTPVVAGSAVLNFRGVTYTDGVTLTNDGLLLRVTENTPNLYYFCDFDNITHVDEGGEDFEEALITVEDDNPRTFGSGFNLLVNEVETDDVITLDIEDGSVTAIDFIGDTASLGAASVTETLTAPTILGNDITASSIISTSNLGLTATAVNVDGNFNIGSNVQVVSSNGNITTSGVLRTNGSLNVSNILTIENNNIATSSGNNILLTPPTGRVAKVDSNTALTIPSGSSAQRPGSGVVENGSIRFNTDSGQYEGYSASTNTWSSLGGVRDIDGNTYIEAEAFTGANDNTLYFYNDGNNTARLTTTHLDFRNVKRIRSANTLAPASTIWSSLTPVTLGQYIRFRNNIYEVTTAGTTGGSQNPPIHTEGTVTNGTAELTYFTTAVDNLIFEEINELQIGPLGNLPLVVNAELRLANNVISTDVEDLVLRPNAGKKLTVDAQTSLVIPAGDSDNRGNPSQGSIRYNTTLSSFEGYSGTNWTSLGGVKDVDGNTYIIPETVPGANENILYFFNDGENTLQLSKTALNFQSISRITSTSDTLEINAELVSFDSFATSINNAGTTTFISSTKDNLDLGLSVGLVNSHLLRLNSFGDIIVNKGFSTNSPENIKVLDNELKDFELDDVKVSSSDILLVKGTNNTGSAIVYSPANSSGAKIVISAHNTTTNDKEFVEYSVCDKGNDIYNTEYGNISTGVNLFSIIFDFDNQDNVRITAELSSEVQTDEEVNLTIVKTIIKK
jgi:hypothetical protein